MEEHTARLILIIIWLQFGKMRVLFSKYNIFFVVHLLTKKRAPQNRCGGWRNEDGWGGRLAGLKLCISA